MKISDLPELGVIVGKFFPLHNGHIYAIHKASTQCQKLKVVLSYDENLLTSQPQNLQDKLTLKNRLLWLKTVFSDLEHIDIHYIDETDIEPYPNGLEDWVHLVKNEIPEKIDVWFSSENEYSDWIHKYFTKNHVIIDPERDFIHISATDIRSNVLQNWDMLPSIVRKDFLLKVCIIGTESCGKTTLSKMLQKIYCTSWVEEYGRLYCENEMQGDESLLKFEDYGLIASNRYYHEKEAEKTANKILICDTNAFITQFYCRLHEGRTSKLVDGFIDHENYDLIIHLDSDVEWVDDGLRISNDRIKTENLMKKMLNEYKITEQNYHKISGNYSERLEKSIELINQLLGEYYNV